MQARLERVRHIRRTVIAVALAVFIALFATIFIQMAVGKDPALGASAGIGAAELVEHVVVRLGHLVLHDNSSSPMTTSQS